MSENQLAHKVKALRKSKGYSQEALAEVAGLSLRTIQRIENENKNPSGDTIKRLSTALSVSPDYLIEWKPNENSNFLLILAFSPILVIINSFLAVIVPLILWSLKKHSIKGVNSLGVKVLSIQIIWLVVYFAFRTLNFFRLMYITSHTHEFVGDQWNSYLADIETQTYLKTFFITVNVIMVIFISYKTYRRNKITSSNLLQKLPS